MHRMSIINNNLILVLINIGIDMQLRNTHSSHWFMEHFEMHQLGKFTFYVVSVPVLNFIEHLGVHTYLKYTAEKLI